MNWTLLLNSLFVAGAVSLLAVGLGFAVAIWLARLPPRSRPLLLAACAATLALPPFLIVNAWQATVSVRDDHPPGFTYDIIGFRLARSSP